MLKKWLFTIGLLLVGWTAVGQTLDTTACDYFEWHNDFYFASGYYTASDDPTQHLNLTIVQSSVSDTFVNACNTFFWKNREYHSSGHFDFLLPEPNSNGCDSTITLHLYLHSTVGDTFAESYDYYDWYGHRYDHTGTFAHTLSDTNSMGCDSVVVLHLHLYTHNDRVVDTCDIYFWHGFNYTASNHYLHDTTLGNAAYRTEFGTGSDMGYRVPFYNCMHHVWMQCIYRSADLGVQRAGYIDTIWFYRNVEADPLTDTLLRIYLAHTNNNFATSNTDWVPQDSLHLVYSGRYYHAPENGWSAIALQTPFYFDPSKNLALVMSQHRVETSQTITYRYSTRFNGSSIYTYADGDSPSDFQYGEYPTGSHMVGSRINYLPNLRVSMAAEKDSDNTMDLTIRYSSEGEMQLTKCDYYHWQVTDQNYSQSGTYEGHMLNSVRCDSLITLQLTVNHKSFGPTYSDSACEYYLWVLPDSTGVDSLLETGTYRDTLVNSVGCDSIESLILFVGHFSTSDEYERHCNSYLWEINDSTYTQTGDYHHTIVNTVGCDSNMNLHLIVDYDTATATAQSPCDQYVWTQAGRTYHNDTVDVATFHTVHGCDSVVTLTLTLRHGNASYIDTTACDAFYWEVKDTMIYESLQIHTMGTNVAGCDSNIHLNLVMHYSTVRHDTVDTCDSYQWPLTPGVVYAHSTNEYIKITNHGGCDSNNYLHLTIRESTIFADNVVACDSFYWAPNDTMFHASGTDHRMIGNTVGCDSLLTLSLTIYPSLSQTDTLSECDSYRWPLTGETFVRDTVTSRTLYYSPAHCDSVVGLNLEMRYSTYRTEWDTACDSYTWAFNGSAYTTSGHYGDTVPNAVMCDSVVDLNLRIYYSTYEEFHNHICEGDTFYFEDDALTETGTYEYQLQTMKGCDSIRMLFLDVLPYYEVAVDSLRHCFTEEYRLAAITEAPYIRWSSEPDDVQLEGAEHDDTVWVKPRGADGTLYSLWVDYADTLTCPTVMEVRMPTLTRVRTAISSTLEYFTENVREAKLSGSVWGSNAMQWYVNGEEKTTLNSLVYTLPQGADSVVLLLEAHNQLCADTDTLVLRTRITRLFIPNAFTPSVEDSPNRFFWVRGQEILDYEIFVYNRQGLVVFHSKDLEQVWNGNAVNGTPLPQDTYIYLIRYIDVDSPSNTKVVKGTVTLIR